VTVSIYCYTARYFVHVDLGLYGKKLTWSAKQNKN